MIRLFVGDDLEDGAQVALDAAQSHYLAQVMRQGPGGEVALFNGRDGEWRARIDAASRRGCRLTVQNPLRAQTWGPDLDLIVALVKRPRLEIIVEKAAELGARRVRLAVTLRTGAGGGRPARLTAIATEAAEQTGRLDVPEIQGPQPLADILAAWSGSRRLMFCDEAGGAPPAAVALSGQASGPWAILIGPEGGFSPEERAAIRALAQAVPVGLGPRILRADTAAIAALALWQAMVGDWRGA